MTQHQYPVYQLESLEAALSRLERRLPGSDFRIEWTGETAYPAGDPCPVVKIVAIYGSCEFDEVVPIVAVRERYAAIIRELIGSELAGGIAGLVERAIEEVRQCEIEEWE